MLENVAQWDDPKRTDPVQKEKTKTYYDKADVSLEKWRHLRSVKFKSHLDDRLGWLTLIYPSHDDWH